MFNSGEWMQLLEACEGVAESGSQSLVVPMSPSPCAPCQSRMPLGPSGRSCWNPPLRACAERLSSHDALLGIHDRARKLEVVADGRVLFEGAHLAIATESVSVLHRDETARFGLTVLPLLKLAEGKLSRVGGRARLIVLAGKSVSAFLGSLAAANARSASSSAAPGDGLPRMAHTLVEPSGLLSCSRLCLVVGSTRGRWRHFVGAPRYGGAANCVWRFDNRPHLSVI